MNSKQQEMCELFVRNLRNYKRSRNLTDNQLAEELNVHYTALRRWLGMNGAPRISVLCTITRRMGVTIDQILLTEIEWI